jgi:hypothetical protein
VCGGGGLKLLSLKDKYDKTIYQSTISSKYFSPRYGSIF